jgi:NDP-sugar pyrophosphorylase family protein
MNAMVLAAGRGTRLASLEPGVPKPLVDIGGEPLLARQLRYLQHNGVGRVVVNAHHLSEAIEAFAREYRTPDRPELIVVSEPSLLGTAGGVRNALEHLGHDPFVILYGDVLISEPLSPMMRAHRESGAAATLAVYETDDLRDKGVVSVDAGGRVTGFVERGRFDPGYRGLVNAGLYIVEPSLIADIPAGAVSDFGHDVFPAALGRGVHLDTFMLAEPVIDVGTPEALTRARLHA